MRATEYPKTFTNCPIADSELSLSTTIDIHFSSAFDFQLQYQLGALLLTHNLFYSQCGRGLAAVMMTLSHSWPEAPALVTPRSDSKTSQCLYKALFILI